MHGRFYNGFYVGEHTSPIVYSIGLTERFVGFLLQPSFFKGPLVGFFGGERWSQSLQMEDKIKWQVPVPPRTATGWPLATIPSMQGIFTYGDHKNEPNV